MDCNNANTICVIPTNQFDAAMALGWQVVLGTLILAVLIGATIYMYFSTKAEWLSQQNRKAELRNLKSVKEPEKPGGLA
jgi:uncharacterized membrane protein YraQ (UPF0718 family)